MPVNYPANNHYLPHAGPYYPDGGPMSANSSSGGYGRERYPSGGSNSGDWGRDFEYRREYDRRPQPPSGTS